MSEPTDLDVGNAPEGTPPTPEEQAQFCAALGAERTPTWAALSGTAISLTFAARPAVRTLTLEGNTAFSATGYAQGRRMDLWLSALVGGTLAFPAAWQWLGTKPASLAAGEVCRIELYCASPAAHTVYAEAKIGTDPDFARWKNGVEAADGAALEAATAAAMGRLVLSAKTQGVWPANGDLTVSSGARTLAGAVFPLLGDALLNTNFVSGDFSRKIGLKGGSGKFLRGGFLEKFSPSETSFFTFKTQERTINNFLQSSFGTISGPPNGIVAIADRYNSGTHLIFRHFSGIVQVPHAGGLIPLGFCGLSGIPGSNTNFLARVGGETNQFNKTHIAPVATNRIDWFCYDSIPSYDGRLSVFGHLPATDLAVWDAILTQYHEDIAAAIP